MTIEKCKQCQNKGIFGACEVRQTTGGDYVCNFMPKNGSATFVIRSNATGTGDINGFVGNGTANTED